MTRSRMGRALMPSSAVAFVVAVVGLATALWLALRDSERGAPAQPVPKNARTESDRRDSEPVSPDSAESFEGTAGDPHPTRVSIPGRHFPPRSHGSGILLFGV